jgi:hypothetical protein
MVMAWLKLRRRNLAPVLNANGWAVNADAIISVPFGRTLTEQVAFPLVKTRGLKPWATCLIVLSCIAVLCLGGWGVYSCTRDKAAVETISPAPEEGENAAAAIEAEAAAAEEGAQ